MWDDDETDEEREEDLRLVAEVTRRMAEYARCEDSATHMDLGLAYLEMGMLDDAEREFCVVLQKEPNDDAGRAALKLVRYRQQAGSVHIGRA